MATAIYNSLRQTQASCDPIDKLDAVLEMRACSRTDVALSVNPHYAHTAPDAAA